MIRLDNITITIDIHDHVSQWSEILDLLECHLKFISKNDIPLSEITNKTVAEHREKIIDPFFLSCQYNVKMVAHQFKRHDCQFRKLTTAFCHLIHGITIVVIIGKDYRCLLPQRVKMPPIMFSVRKRGFAFRFCFTKRIFFHNVRFVIRQNIYPSDAPIIIYYIIYINVRTTFLIRSTNILQLIKNKKRFRRKSAWQKTDPYTWRTMRRTTGAERPNMHTWIPGHPQTQTRCNLTCFHEVHRAIITMMRNPDSGIARLSQSP